MNFRNYSLGLLSVATLLPLVPAMTNSVQACAVVAPSTQVAVSGDPNQVTQQNQISTSYDDNCLGNAAVGTNTQVGIGSGEISQTHQGDFSVGGGAYNQTGYTSPNVEVTPEIQLNIYSPAHDPNYLNHLYPH
jgi:hypothetical protein